MVRTVTNPGTWDRIDAIFAAAVELAAPDRAAYLSRACGGDEQLRAEIQNLLSAHDRTGALDRLGARIVGDVDAALPPPPDAGARVGPYEIRETLGQGGMGVVYLAHRAGEGFEQRVALKVLRAGPRGDDVVARFLAERGILARLEHPNITRFLDGGLTSDGTPWFAMEYVEGTPLDKYCDGRSLTIRQRLALFVSLCDAIQYAHQHLVVHRDLKPSNILVTAGGVVKVLDFGIAKLLDDSQGLPQLTGTGERWMTPDYASPEQVRGQPVATSADVFALGVVLYELMCGRRPHPGATRHEVEQAILDFEPTRPSASCTAGMRASRGMKTDKGCRELVGDIDTITLKALDKVPSRRYGTAGELADDIRRHLAGLPVRARPDTFTYRVRKFVARHRALVAATSVATVTVLAFAVMTAVAERRIRATAERASLERDRAEQVSQFVVGLFAAADPLRPQGSAEVTARELLDSGAARLRRELANQPEQRARLLEVLAQSYDGLGRYPEAQTAIGEAVAIRRAQQPLDTMALYAALERQARLYIVRGLVDSAGPPAREGIALRRAGAPNSALLGSELYVLGDLSRASGRLDSAEYYLRAALVELGDTAAPGVRADIMDNLAAVLVHDGRMAEVETLLVRSLALRQQQYPPGHPAIGSGYGALATVRLDLGKLPEARAGMEQALAIFLASVGRDHPYVAYQYHALGSVAAAQRDFDSSDSWFSQSVAVKRTLFGAGHLGVARTLIPWGQMRTTRGDYRGAESLLVRAVEIRRAAAGDTSATTALARVILADTYRASGRARTAETLYAAARPWLEGPRVQDSVRQHVDQQLAALRRRRG